MLDIKCPDRLNRLLAKIWDFYREQELAHHNTVAIHAAQKAIEEPGEISVVVPGFGYRIVFEENGKKRPDPLAQCYPESKPTRKIIQQARDIRKRILEEMKEIAEEKRQPPICWDGEQVVIESFLARYPSIAAKWAESVEFGERWAEQGGTKEQIWEFVARQILQAADPLRPFNTVQLFRYAEQVCEEGTVFSDNASHEINRLDCNGFTDRLWGDLVERYSEELREIGLLEEELPPVIESGPETQFNVPKIPKKGVSLDDAAFTLADEDSRLVKGMKKRWQNSKSLKLLKPIGLEVKHKQRKLYEPSELSDFIEKIDGKSTCIEHELRARLARKARSPRDEETVEKTV